MLLRQLIGALVIPDRSVRSSLLRLHSYTCDRLRVGCKVRLSSGYCYSRGWIVTFLCWSLRLRRRVAIGVEIVLTIATSIFNVMCGHLMNIDVFSNKIRSLQRNNKRPGKLNRPRTSKADRISRSREENESGRSTRRIHKTIFFLSRSRSLMRFPLSTFVCLYVYLCVYIVKKRSSPKEG